MNHLKNHSLLLQFCDWSPKHLVEYFRVLFFFWFFTSREFCRDQNKLVSVTARVFKMWVCSIAWRPHYLTYIDRIKNIQIRFLRFLRYKCTFRLFPGNTENYNIRLKFFNKISLEDRRKVNHILFFANSLTSSFMIVPR